MDDDDVTGDLPARTVCMRCRADGGAGQTAGDTCAVWPGGGVGPQCGGVLRYRDGRAIFALLRVGRGIDMGRSRTDICTDIAGSREAVTPEVRRYVEAACDLLGYLPHQSMFREGANA